LTNRRGYGGSRQRQVEDLSDGLSVVSFAQQKEKVNATTVANLDTSLESALRLWRTKSPSVVDLTTMIASE